MKIAIIGATGNVGSRLVSEALARGHSVTAIARDVSRLDKSSRLVPVEADAQSPNAIAAALTGHDAVISAVGFSMAGPAALIKAIRDSGVKRYLVVGGAGSLETANGKLHVESDSFPAPHKKEALLGKAFLDALKDANDLEWTMLSPSALFIAGERTGKFRLGADSLLVSDSGKSWISYEDYAIAMLDEVENPQHIARRFTVGY